MSISSTQVSLAAALHSQSKGFSFLPHFGRFIKLFLCLRFNFTVSLLF